MENALNLIWLSMCAATFIYLLSRPSSRTAKVCLCAAIALVLLFPYISISDDIQQQVGLAESANSYQDVLKAAVVLPFLPVAESLADAACERTFFIAAALLDSPEPAASAYWPVITKRPPPVSFHIA